MSRSQWCTQTMSLSDPFHVSLRDQENSCIHEPRPICLLNQRDLPAIYFFFYSESPSTSPIAFNPPKSQPISTVKIMETPILPLNASYCKKPITSIIVFHLSPYPPAIFLHMWKKRWREKEDKQELKSLHETGMQGKRKMNYWNLEGKRRFA